MEITVVSGKGDKKKTTALQLDANATVADLKKAYEKVTKKSIYR